MVAGVGSADFASRLRSIARDEPTLQISEIARFDRVAAAGARTMTLLFWGFLALAFVVVLLSLFTSGMTGGLFTRNVIVVGRESPKSLYSPTLVTFEDDKGAYDQKDAEGFIKLNALRLRILAERDKKRGKNE